MGDCIEGWNKEGGVTGKIGRWVERKVGDLEGVGKNVGTDKTQNGKGRLYRRWETA